MEPITQEQLESLLLELPRITPGGALDAKFYAAHYPETARAPRLGIFSWPRLAASFIAAIIFLFTGLTALAYRDSVTPESALYGIKRAAEKIELALAFGDQNEIDAHLKFSDRRLNEAENAVKRETKMRVLSEMRKAVEESARLTEERIENSEAAEIALAKIESRTEAHVERLNLLMEKFSNDSRDAFERFAGEEDDALARAVEARERATAARENKIEKFRVRFMEREDAFLATEAAPTEKKRGEKAGEEFNKALSMFNALPEEEQEKFEEKIQMAADALKDEKFGRAKGLSWALQNRMENLPHRTNEADNEEPRDTDDIEIERDLY